MSWNPLFSRGSAFKKKEPLTEIPRGDGGRSPPRVVCRGHNGCRRNATHRLSSGGGGGGDGNSRIISGRCAERKLVGKTFFSDSY